MPNPSVTLCMIERDEAHVLPRSIASFLALEGCGCDLSYGIVDGGSEDGSMELVGRLMGDIPGEVALIRQPKPLDDFAKARNGSIEVARHHGDWLIFLDADDEFVVEPWFVWPQDIPGVGGYKIWVQSGTDSWQRTAIVRAALPWAYVGEMHENIECAIPTEVRELDGIRILVHPGEGARSKDPRQKFLNDAMVLRKALVKAPGNLRHLFYLAQSLRDAGELEESLVVYQERASHTEGWAEETYFALIQVARIKGWLNRPVEDVTDAFLAAHRFRPTRAESLGMLSEYLRMAERYHSAAFFARLAMGIPRPQDYLFVTGAWYEWKAEDEFAISSYWTGAYQACRDACLALLTSRRLPEGDRARVEANLNFANKALGVV